MKINGVEVSGPSEEVLVLPRLDGNDLVFRAQAVMSTEEFQKKVPEPKPNARLVAGGKWEKSLDDPAFQEAARKYGELRYAYYVLKSLEPSNIEWDTVDLDKPSTWANWSEDLRNAGLNETEVNRVSLCVARANSLDETKLEAARESFLRGLVRASEKSSGLSSELKSTPSGEGANG